MIKVLFTGAPGFQPDAYQVQQLISNSAIFASCVALSFLFLRAIWTTWRTRKERQIAWYDTFEAKYAIASAGIFVVGGLSRLFSVTLLQLRSWGISTDALESLPIPTISGISFVIFSACMIRILTRNNREWIVFTLLIIAFCALMWSIHGYGRAVL